MARDVGRQDLDGDRAAQPRVARAIDLTDPARADAVENLVVTQALEHEGASGPTAPELFHGPLDELLRVVELLENQRDIHSRLAGKALAPAVHSVLTDERERVG